MLKQIRIRNEEMCINVNCIERKADIQKGINN